MTTSQTGGALKLIVVDRTICSFHFIHETMFGFITFLLVQMHISSYSYVHLWDIRLKTLTGIKWRPHVCICRYHQRLVASRYFICTICYLCVQRVCRIGK